MKVCTLQIYCLTNFYDTQPVCKWILHPLPTFVTPGNSRPTVWTGNLGLGLYNVKIMLEMPCVWKPRIGHRMSRRYQAVWTNRIECLDLNSLICCLVTVILGKLPFQATVSSKMESINGDIYSIYPRKHSWAKTASYSEPSFLRGS